MYLQLECLGLAAPTRDIDHSRHRAEAPLKHPILQGLEIENAVAGRADELIPVDFANRADRRNLRLRVVQQGGQLRQTVQNLLQSLFIGVIECELQLDVRKTIKRDGSNRGQIPQPGSL